MIFQYTWPQIVNREKTATRRVIDPAETAVRGQYNRILAVKHGGRVKWRIGQTYAVQPGRGKKQLARIKLTRITRQKLPRITNREAVKEGFANRRDFMQTWLVIHGEAALESRVWVLEFELVEIIDPKPLDAQPIAKERVTPYVYQRPCYSGPRLSGTA